MATSPTTRGPRRPAPGRTPPQPRRSRRRSRPRRSVDSSAPTGSSTSRRSRPTRWPPRCSPRRSRPRKPRARAAAELEAAQAAEAAKAAEEALAAQTAPAEPDADLVAAESTKSRRSPTRPSPSPSRSPPEPPRGAAPARRGLGRGHEPRAGARTDRRRGRARARAGRAGRASARPGADRRVVGGGARGPGARTAHRADQRDDPPLPDAAGRAGCRAAGGRRGRDARSWRRAAPSSTCSASAAPSSRRCRPSFPTAHAARPSRPRSSPCTPRPASGSGRHRPARSRAPSATWASRTAASADCPCRRTPDSAADAARGRPSRPDELSVAEPLDPFCRPRRSRASASRPSWASTPSRGPSPASTTCRASPGVGPVEAGALEDDPGGIEHAPQLASAPLADRWTLIEHRVDHLGGRSTRAALVVIGRHGRGMMANGAEARNEDSADGTIGCRRDQRTGRDPQGTRGRPAHPAPAGARPAG